jgi:peptidoglycan hydrolase CwlO-like protein
MKLKNNIMTIKDLFTIKQQNPIIANCPQTENVQTDSIDFTELGRQQAEAVGGHSNVFHPALLAAHYRIEQQVKQNEILQIQRKADIQSQIESLKTENDNLSNKKSQRNDELKHEERKIDEAKDEISAIRNNPSRILNESGSPVASFVIGLFIIVFLTIYLFVFYSSAAYSAFFKEFNPESIGIATAIFDSQALAKAIRDGFTEMILIITIPAVFLGLGYLIHRFSNDPKASKLSIFGKISALMLVTFAFDSILAYEITEKIYEVGRNNSFTEMPSFTFSMAFTDMRFWLIIFSGFVVYIIWGLVFNFVMKEYYKLDRVKVAIEELEKKIKEYKLTCKEIKRKIGDLDTMIYKNNGEIKKLEQRLSGTIVLRTDIELEINNFVNGWLAYMEFKHISENEKSEVVKIKTDYFNTISNQFKPL